MDFPRRHFLRFAAGMAALSGFAQAAWADTYPSRPVRLVVGFPPGTSSDITSRLIAQALSERFNKPFLVENRPGAGTNIATEEVVHAPPDGYSLLWITQTNAINASLYDNLDFNFSRDIQPVASIIRVPAAMLVTASFPAKTVPEFTAYAKANPGKINMCSPGIGSANHVFGALFEMMTGVELVHVPYRDSWMPDLISGQTQVTFNPLPASLGLINGGKARVLAVTSATRQSTLPNVPTVAEFVPGYEATAWFGIGVPKATPGAIVAALNQAIGASLAAPKIKARLAELGGDEFSGSPGDFEKFIVAETDKWAKVIKFANIKAE